MASGDPTLRVGGDVRGAEGALQRLNRASSSLKNQADQVSKSLGKINAVLGAGGLIAVGGGAVRAMDEMVQRSIKFQNVMGNLKFPIDAARKSTKGLITDFDLAKSAVAATSLGITKSEEDFAKFSKAAVVLGSKLGIDTTQAMEQLTAAVGRGSAKILDNFGIMAKGFESMSMEERLDLIAKATEDTNFQVSEGAQAWNQLKNELDNLANDALPAVAWAAGLVAEEIQDVTGVVRGLSDALGEDGFQWENMLPTLKSATEAYIEMQKPLLGVAGYMDRLAPSTDVATEALDRQTIAVKGLVGQWLDAQEAMRPKGMTKEEQAAFEKQFGIDHGQGMGGLEQGPLLGANASDFQGKKKGRGKKRGPVSPTDRDRPTHFGLGDDIASQAAINASQREMEVRRQAIEVMEAEAGSTQAVFDAKIQLAEQEQNYHEAALLRIEKRKAAEEALAEAQEEAEKRKQKAYDTTARIAGMSGDYTMQTMDLVVKASGASGEHLVRIQERMDAAKMFIRAGVETVEAVASFARYDYIGGAAHVAAAALATATGALIASGAMRDKASSAGASGGGGGGSFQGSGGSAGGFNSRPSGFGDSDNAPVSPLDERVVGSGRGEGAKSNSGGDTYNIQGPVLMDDDFFTKLEHMKKKSNRRVGDTI